MVNKTNEITLNCIIVPFGPHHGHQLSEVTAAVTVDRNPTRPSYNLHQNKYHGDGCRQQRSCSLSWKTISNYWLRSECYTMRKRLPN
ncbi:unnamed protein product [Rhizophagus irregularis]|nr:unnamed protein product [Rhizophagus irregularis]